MSINWGLASLEVAIEYDKDWDIWWWLGAIAVGLIAVALIATALPTWGAIDDRFEYGATGVVLKVGYGILLLAAAWVLLVLPGSMMRHVAVHANVWWVIAAWALVALFFLWLGAGRFALSWAGYLPAITIGIGVVVGVANDALQRFASWIPTTGAAVVTVIVAAILIVYLKSRE